jgi:hypothetical protein
MFKSIVNPLFHQLNRNISRTRNFTFFNGSGYVALLNPTAVSEGELVSFYANPIGDGRIIDGDDNVSLSSGVVTLSSNLKGFVNGKVIESGVTSIAIGEANFFELIALSDTSFSHISSSVLPITSIIWNVRFPLAYFPLDESIITPVAHDEKVNASNELALTPTTIGSDWVNIDGVYTLDTDGATPSTLEFISQANQAGNTYIIRFHVKIVTGAISYKSSSYPRITESGWVENVVTIPADGSYFLQFKRAIVYEAANAMFSNISIKEISQAGIYTNRTSDDVIQGAQ